MQWFYHLSAYLFRLRFVLVAPIAIHCIACAEFFSVDVAEESLELNSPADSLYTQLEEITFWWEEYEFAEGYRFQLVSPNFDQPVYIFDTLLRENQLSFSLTEDPYVWRIRMENEGSSSPYQLRHFFIDQTDPFLPIPVFPQDSSTLSVQSISHIVWSSEDRNSVGFTLPTVDSIYLYKQVGTQLDLILQAESQTDSLNVQGMLDENTQYQWQVIVIDAAGNTRTGDVVMFTTN